MEELSDYSRNSETAEHLGFSPNTLRKRGSAGNLAAIRQLLNESRLSPLQSVGLTALALAVQQLENLTGEKGDIEERSIATVLKKAATVELEDIHRPTAYRTAYERSSISKQLRQTRGGK